MRFPTWAVRAAVVGLLGAVLVPIAPFATISAAEDPPDVQFGAETVPFELDDRAEFNPWGVTGINTSGEERRDPFKANVLALEAHGDRMYVGGRFTHVRNGPNASPIARPFLAAFDLTTGEWISSFTPALDGRVFDIEFTDDGKMIIGGDFSNVNGAPLTSGLAALDPITGAVDGTWHANVTRSTAGVLPVVRTIDEKDGWLYVGGVFSHVEGGTWNRVRIKNVAKLAVSDGSPESQFRPDVTNIVRDISVSPVSDRVHLVGNFSSVDGDTTHGFFATLDNVTGAPVSGMGPMQFSTGTSTSHRYQHAVLEYDGHVYVGGSQHSFQKYTTDTRTMLYSHITRQGGDFQAVEQFKGQLFGSCHCGDWNYEGTNNFSNPSNNDGRHPINLVGQYNGTDFRYVSEWYPEGLKGDGGDGVWAIEGAGDCLWVGGDIDRSRWSGDPVTDFAGGFARFCGNDTTPPTTPTNVGVTRSGDQATVTFTRGTDAGGIATHEIYKNGVVIGTSSSSSFVDGDAAAGGYYLVRAVDNAGNKSATLAPAYLGAAGVSSTLLAAGSVWRYQDSGAQAPADWATPGFDDSTWASGPAHIGWGDGDEATVVGPTRPTTVYLRSNFNVSDPGAYSSLNLGLVRDDGAAVYINGVEVVRDNLPTGPLTATTTATDYVWGAGEVDPVPYVVPAGVLTAGVNTVAVELHQLGNPDASFDLSIDGVAGAGDTTPPSAPTVHATGGNRAVSLDWTAATDDIAVGGYLVRRDGTDVAIVNAATTSFTDSGLADGTTYSYDVTAFDTSGNATTSSPVAATTFPPTQLLSAGSVWRYQDSGAQAPADWATSGFDDSTWASGPAHIGWGDGDEATVVGPTRPTTVYLRSSFNVSDPNFFSTLLIGLVRDDGAAVYINGVEVVRDNLPTGPLTATTTATDYVWGAAEYTAVPYVVPAGVLTAGVNTVAVELHQLGNPDASFDLSIDGQP